MFHYCCRYPNVLQLAADAYVQNIPLFKHSSNQYTTTMDRRRDILRPFSTV